MSSDEMEIVNPKTSGKKCLIGSDNKIQDTHDCIFQGDHSNGLNCEDICVICGKKLGDLIAEGFDPTKSKIPIIITKGEQEDEHFTNSSSKD